MVQMAGLHGGKTDGHIRARRTAVPCRTHRQLLAPPALESADQIKRRNEEASAYVDIDRLALSPQCGFASLYTGNPITFEDQVNKLRLIVEVARDVWDYTPAAAG